jgi:hypothetical protein
MASTDEILDELMEHCKKHEDPTGENGFLRQLFRTSLYQDKKSIMSEQPGICLKDESQ